MSQESKETPDFIVLTDEQWREVQAARAALPIECVTHLVGVIEALCSEPDRRRLKLILDELKAQLEKAYPTRQP